MIPEAAVEAAAIAWVGEYVWQDCNHAWQADYLERTRTILEGAASHMLGESASAWHDAVSEAYVDGALSADQAAVMYNTNPYRPTP